MRILWRLGVTDKLLRGILPPRQLAAYRRFRTWHVGEPELRLLKYLCDPESISIDVGAHKGDYTYYLRKYSRKCYAFEPNPDLAVRLDQAFGDGVVVEACALSDHTGAATLTIPVVDGVDDLGLASIESSPVFEGHVTRTVSVPTRRLDDCDIKGVGFIKIDVEGHEMAVLRGAKAMLDRESPSILIEVEERRRPGIIKDVLRFMREREYDGFFLLSRKLHSLEMFDPEVHQKLVDPRALSGEAAGSVYIYNFLFLKDRTVVDRMSKLFA